jgi:hypothetical protein
VAILVGVSWSSSSLQMNTSYLKTCHDHHIAIPYLLTNTEALIDASKEVGIKVNTEALIDASKEVGIKVNTEETKYILMSFHQNARQNCDTKIANRSFEYVSEFKYLGATVMNQSLIHEEIKLR